MFCVCADYVPNMSDIRHTFDTHDFVVCSQLLHNGQSQNSSCTICTVGAMTSKERSLARTWETLKVLVVVSGAWRKQIIDEKEVTGSVLFLCQLRVATRRGRMGGGASNLEAVIHSWELECTNDCCWFRSSSSKGEFSHNDNFVCDL